MIKIATIKTDFPTKFGVPRQSGRVSNLRGKIIFEPEYRRAEALRGLEGYSHIWLIWEFSQLDEETRTGKVWRPTVRPPRLGGNKRVGVFATRSPYRPNPIGLSSVRLVKIEQNTNDGPVLIVEGADLVSGTPIYDIKPYLPNVDSHPEAVGGFADEVNGYKLDVHIPERLSKIMNDKKLNELKDILKEDPRPSYQNDPDREYGFLYAEYEIKFKVSGNDLTVTEITSL